jgi:hypothetical protein
MAVHLDHFMVPARNKVASAKLLAELWGRTALHPCPTTEPQVRERWIDYRL